MADENPTDRGLPDPSIPADADHKVESATLSYLLDEYPDRFTILEVSRVLNGGEVDFGSEDAIERAIRELVGAGLLHCHSGAVLPTRAALYFHRLEQHG